MQTHPGYGSVEPSTLALFRASNLPVIVRSSSSPATGRQNPTKTQILLQHEQRAAHSHTITCNPASAPDRKNRDSWQEALSALFTAAQSTVDKLDDVTTSTFKTPPNSSLQFGAGVVKFICCNNAEDAPGNLWCTLSPSLIIPSYEHHTN